MLKSRYSLNAMVTTPHHLASQAGAEILQQGGNAVEAAVAAAAALGVVYPHMNSIGGDGFWLISEPGKAPVAIQACGFAGGEATPDFYHQRGFSAIPTRGPEAALTVAGAVAGWIAALEEAANWPGKSLPLRMLVEKAVQYALEGIVISRSQAQLLKNKWEEFDGLEDFKTLFSPTGISKEKDVLFQHDLASTLQHLAEAGLEDFYRGDLARRIASGLERCGSPLRLSDLESYRARTVSPLSVNLSVGTAYNHPPPTQGVSSLMILGIFDRLGVSECDSFEHLHGLIEATKHAFNLRNRYVDDPATMQTDCASWLDQSVLDEYAGAINTGKAAPWPHTAEAGDTVWLGVIDREGRAVSYIQSIYFEFGSGLVVPDTGILWQNRGSSFLLQPGLRSLMPGRYPFHTLNPAMLRFRDGRTMVYGTMGGEGQPQTQAAVATRYGYFGMDLQQAVTAPRWLLGKTWGDDTLNLKVEDHLPQDLVRRLAEAGHDVEQVPAYNDMMGHAGAIVLDSDGLYTGAVDPRSDGSVVAL